MSGAPGEKSPIQSVDVGVAMPLHVAVTVPPRATLPGLTLIWEPGGDTVRGPLVASRVKPLLAIRRSWYVPGVRAAGMENGQEPDARAAPGAWEQLTYIQSMYCVSGAPGEKSPIQSVGVGLTMPLHVAVTLPPGATLAGDTLS